MTKEQEFVLETRAEQLEELARIVLVHAMGDRPFTHDEAAVRFIDEKLSKGVHFKQLVSILVSQ